MQCWQVQGVLTKAGGEKTHNNRDVVVHRRHRKAAFLRQMATEFPDNSGLRPFVRKGCGLANNAFN